MTADVTALPEKSEADCLNLRRCLLVISETDTVFGVSLSVSSIEKATVDPLFCGCAEP